MFYKIGKGTVYDEYGIRMPKVLPAKMTAKRLSSTDRYTEFPLWGEIQTPPLKGYARVHMQNNAAAPLIDLTSIVVQCD